MKCDLCKRVLSSEEYAADPQLCPDCLNWVNIYNNDLNSGVIANKKSNKILVISWFLLCAILTAVGSYNFTCPIFWLFDCLLGRSSGGFMGNSVLCLASAIPGLLGFFSTSVFFNTKLDPYSRSAQSALMGIAIACFAAIPLGIWG